MAFRFRRVVVGASSIAVLGVGAWVLQRAAGPISVPPSASSKSPNKEAIAKSDSDISTHTAKPAFHSWPSKPEIVGPPGGVAKKTHLHPSVRKADPTSSTGAIEEPKAPSSKELTEEAQRTGDALLPESALAILLDDSKSSTLKLAIIDKLKTLNPEEVVPVLVEFLERPGSSATAYTKPTAIQVLADLRHPLAEQALARLARGSADERVRLTVMALQAKEKSR